MAEHTAISWADDTFNPWIGCQKTGSQACVPCYAENLMDTRMGRVKWGAPHEGVGTRARTAPSYWAKVLKWNREAEADAKLPLSLRRWPRGRFVFCASLADVFDAAVDPQWRKDLFDLIRATPHLTWLLLTKRPQNIVKMFAEGVMTGTYGARVDQIAEKAIRGAWPANAAIGCTVVTQAEANRDVPHLLHAKAILNPAFAFLSLEPLVEFIDLTKLEVKSPPGGEDENWGMNALTGQLAPIIPLGIGEWALDGGGRYGPKIDWVITGGCTDQGKFRAWPTAPDDFRLTRDQCAEAGVAYHHKQNGEWAPGELVERKTGKVEVAWRDGDGWSYGKENLADTDGHIDDEPTVYRIGKKAAGRMLDGVIHDARPTLRRAA